MFLTSWGVASDFKEKDETQQLTFNFFSANMAKYEKYV